MGDQYHTIHGYYDLVTSKVTKANAHICPSQQIRTIRYPTYTASDKYEWGIKASPDRPPFHQL